MKVKNSNKVSRRKFIGASAATITAFNFVPRHVLGAPGKESANEKLNIGCIGVGGMQGGGDTNAMRGENVYALCDVDENYLNKMAQRMPSAKTYRDYREMLDKEHKNLDAVTITIPDHMHASVALAAMERGLHVYCQKPLTQTVWEARLLTEAAKKYKVITQMGNQGYSCEATRMACEIIWSGQIGEVKEVHAMNGGGFARGVKKWPEPQDVPAHLDWDLWQGRVKEKPYYPKIHPIDWRGYLDYGTQMIGDWGIHILGPANWGMALGSPSSVECIEVDGVNPVTYPNYAVKFEFPKRKCEHVKGGKMPPLTLYWYEGSKARSFKKPKELEGKNHGGFNCLFVGDKGVMGTSGRGEGVRLLPEEAMQDFKKQERVIDRVPRGHYNGWISACKSGKEPCSNFKVAGPYTEWLLLGAISWRFPNQKLKWNGKKLKFTNNKEANEFVKPDFRKGWKLKMV
ncbi:hypothetical protein BVX94_02075 [bacterium B17]|nr:hypothetical protein BVX94_02075 [bacterium B17]